MTNFLPAGIINETLEDLCQRIAQVRQDLAAGDIDTVKNGLSALEEAALSLWIFIEKFPCQPLLYTGQGSTDEIIRRLEWALTFMEEFDPATFNQHPKRHRK